MSMSGSRPVARRIIGVETEYGITCAPAGDGPPPLDADHAARELFEPVVQRSRSYCISVLFPLSTYGGLAATLGNTRHNMLTKLLPS